MFENSRDPTDRKERTKRLHTKCRRFIVNLSRNHKGTIRPAQRKIPRVGGIIESLSCAAPFQE